MYFVIDDETGRVANWFTTYADAETFASSGELIIELHRHQIEDGTAAVELFLKLSVDDTDIDDVSELRGELDELFQRVSALETETATLREPIRYMRRGENVCW